MKKEEITLKNTKAEILEALNAALEREKNASKVKSDPVKEEKEKKVEKAIENTKQNVEQKIFSDELINKFKELELAISAEEEKLKELYGIEKELNNLTMVVNTGKDIVANIEKERQEREIQLNENIKKLEEDYKIKMDNLQKDYDLKISELKKERDREQEEYDYKIKREREISKNTWEDDKKKREEKLKEEETEIQKSLSEIKEKEKNIKDMEKQVEEFPKKLVEEYEKGKKEVTKELEKEHKYETELLVKDFQSTIDRLKDKVESLETELTKQRELNSNLQEKLDKSYTEMKELAKTTVEANGAVKIIRDNHEEIK